MFGGCFAFGSPDAALLVSLLPALLHVRGLERLSVLVRLVRDESTEQRAGRELLLGRLVEVRLIEALRSTTGEGAPPGLLRRQDVTLAQVAERVGYSSASTFSTAFSRHVGQAPSLYQNSTRQRSVPGTSSRRASAMSE